MKTTAALAALALLVAGCAVATDSTTTFGGQVTVTSQAPGAGSVTTIEIPDGESATIVRVFDGDSFEAEVDGEIVEVRMLGINAPEGSECHGDAARDRLRELVDGVELTLVADGEDREDRFGRLLRSVYVPNGFVNATMVAEGQALALQSGDPQEDLLTELSDAAYDQQLGMWSPEACDENGAPTVTVVEVEYDPSGRDWENKNEEWVVVFNESDQAVDMSGWIVRDESSTHRYEFPAGEVLETGDSLRVRTGCGDDRGEDRYWCADDAVWSNGGDSVILQTAAGTVVDRVRYSGDF